MTIPHTTPAAILPELLDLIRFQQEYIVAIPSDVAASLPAMPGFDGDWAVDLVERAKALAASPNTTASGAAYALLHILDAIKTGRFVPVGPESLGYCKAAVQAAERALAASAPVAPTQPDWRELCRLHALAVADADRILAEWRAYKPAPIQQGEYLPLPEPLVIRWPELNAHALGCGVEDRGMHDRYRCAEYGWQDGLDRAVECVPEEIYSAEQLHAYVDADRASRGAAQAAPAEPDMRSVALAAGAYTTAYSMLTHAKVHNADVDGSTKRLVAAINGLRSALGPSAPVAEDADQPHGFIKPDTGTHVYFYEQDFYVLSNFSAFTLYWDDVENMRFDTSEAAYHWEKFPGHDDIRAAIINAPSAHEAFKVAERNKAHRRPDWDDVKVDVMRRILRAKVEQHEYVRRKLLATGARILVEDSWRDNVWGWGPNRDGQNLLGKLWMEVRDELRAQAAQPEGAKP